MMTNGGRQVVRVVKGMPVALRAYQMAHLHPPGPACE